MVASQNAPRYLALTSVPIVRNGGSSLWDCVCVREWERVCEGAGVCVQERVVMVSYVKGRGQSQLRINHPYAYTHSPTQHTHNRLARNHGSIINTEVASCNSNT